MCGHRKLIFIREDTAAMNIIGLRMVDKAAESVWCILDTVVVSECQTSYAIDWQREITDEQWIWSDSLLASLQQKVLARLQIIEHYNILHLTG